MIVTWFPTGTQLERLIIRGEDIQDLEIEQQLPSTPSGHTATPLDPAIVSFTRPPVAPDSSSVSQISVSGHHIPDGDRFAVSPLHSDSHANATRINQKLHGFVKEPHTIPRSYPDPEQSHRLATAVLTEPFSELSLSGHDPIGASGSRGAPPPIQEATDNGEEPNPSGELTKTKRRRSRKKRGISKVSEGVKATDSVRIAIEKTNIGPSVNKGPGWPQHTEFLHHQQTPPFKQYAGKAELQIPTPNRNQNHNAAARKNTRQGHKSRRSDLNDQNGWATEEVTDIQDMGDFDFEGNLSKFDKRKIFEQIRQEDTTADESRLVSFNRVASRPGTYGGKNLHFTENVLDSPVTKHLSSSNSESDLNLREAGISSRRCSHRGPSRSSHRGPSRSSTRKGPSRKDSGMASNDSYGLDHSSAPDNDMEKSLKNSQTTLLSSVMQSSFSNRSHKATSNKFARALRTTSSSRDCPCLTPLQMMELEQLVISRFGLSEDMITENAGSTIAQTARKLSSSNADLKGFERDIPPRPFIVILAGNHKTASRAIAAARHLRSHSAQVVLCILGLEREADLLDDVRRQLNIFRAGGGKAIRPDQLMQRLKGSMTNLILDAMFGIHLTFHDLRFDDQSAYLQLLRWSNSMNATTLSIDIPSGVDASTGEQILIL